MSLVLERERKGKRGRERKRERERERERERADCFLDLSLVFELHSHSTLSFIHTQHLYKLSFIHTLFTQPQCLVELDCMLCKKVRSHVKSHNKPLDFSS